MFASSSRRTVCRAGVVITRCNQARPANIISRSPYRSYSSKPNLNEAKSKWTTIDEITRSAYILDMKELLNEMEKRKYNTRIILFGLGGIFIWIFYGLITKWASKQTTVITTQSLEDPKFQKKVIEFCENTITELVKSPQVQQDTATLLNDAVIEICQREAIKDQLTDLFKYIFETEIIKHSAAELSADTVNKLLNSPDYEEFRKHVQKYISEIVVDVTSDEKMQEELGNMIWNSIKSMFSNGSDNNVKE